MGNRKNTRHLTNQKRKEDNHRIPNQVERFCRLRLNLGTSHQSRSCTRSNQGVLYTMTHHDTPVTLTHHLSSLTHHYTQYSTPMSKLFPSHTYKYSSHTI